MNTSLLTWPIHSRLCSRVAAGIRRSTGRTLKLQEERALPRSTHVLCRLDDIPDGGVRGVDPPDPGGLPLLLMREGDRVYGWLNVCPQDGRRMNVAPGLFRVEHGDLHCAIRGAVFDLRDGGRCISGPCRGRPLVSVPLRIEQGRVLRDPCLVRAD